MATSGLQLAKPAFLGVLVLLSLRAAYQIRLFAINTFGLVIHEFDPWFNFRATQYLADNGWKEFFHWYDHSSWYPLGRPVGTTIYPGMQFTAVGIWEALKLTPFALSLNDVCCYVPVWFGVIATMLLGLLTYECSGSAGAAVLSTMIMSILPAHLMRSVGGGFDNESVAMTAMILTFWLWNLSLRERKYWVFGIFSGYAYAYMAAVWGGYIFVLNMVALHALFLLVFSYTPNLHKAYTLFYVIGTTGAMRVPVVGYTPLKSLEQLGALAVFGCMQICFAVDKLHRGKDLGLVQIWKERVKFGFIAFVAAGMLGYVALPAGYFGPLSARVRGLFVKHTRTGNPLVDSVAEHQPASPTAYYQYLQLLCYFAPLGFVSQLKTFALAVTSRPRAAAEPHRDARTFLVLYGLVPVKIFFFIHLS